MKTKHLNYIKQIGLAITMFVLIVACSDKSTLVDIPTPNKSEDGYVKLEFTLPEFIAKSANTRAMDDNAEADIKVEDLTVLVFNKESVQTLEYIATVVDNSLLIQGNKASVTVKLSKTADQVDIFVVANYAVNTPLVEGTTTLTGLIESMEFSMPKAAGNNNIWNASATNYTPIPMSGKATVNGINENQNNIKIPLFRSLARVDIGLNFILAESDSKTIFTDEAEGLSNFKLKEVYAYRTNEKGYVAALPNINEKLPSIPSAPMKRANDAPLIYQLSQGQENAFVREIYLPESSATASSSSVQPNDEIHTIVIGGSFEDQTKTTYYRLDFAQDDVTDKTRTFLPILRNHRYVFNILSVRSPGFETPERALASTPTANLDYELIEWDETAHETQIKGEHYFSLNNRDLMFDPVRVTGSDDNSPENFFELDYKTNYPLSSELPLRLEWENPENSADLSISKNFKAEWIKDRKVIKITKRGSNETNRLITEVLHARFGTFDIPITVSQDYVVFEYMLNCETVMVEGSYIINQPLGAAHKITLSIKVDKDYMVGRTYRISTEEVNGISFHGTGKINNTGNQNIVLQGRGTLTVPKIIETDDKGVEHQVESVEPFSIQIISNSSSGSSCEATISPVRGKIAIVTSASAGYKWSYSTYDMYKVLTAPSNFGPNDNSKVKVEGLSFVSSDLLVESSSNKKWLQGFRDSDGVWKMADILQIGHGGLVDTNTRHNIILEFMKNGGVVIILYEVSIHNFMNKLFNTSGLSTPGAGFTSSTTPFLGHPSLKGDKTDEEWATHLEELRQDPIMNGPFGDVTEYQWGQDAGASSAIKGVNEETTKGLTVYSRGGWLDNGTLKNWDPNIMSSFRYQTEDYNFIYVGDGGAGTNNGGSSTTIFPFAYDSTTKEPIPKPYGGSMDAYNSQWLSNVMAWAVDRANSLELRQKKERHLQSLQ